MEDQDKNTDQVLDSINSSSTNLNPDSKITKSEEKNEVLNAIKFVYDNVHSAQSLKGVFTMTECLLVIESKNKLIEFFETGNKNFVTDETNEAFLSFVRACEKQQSTGVFHMEGSVLLLNAIRLIEKELSKRKSPADSLKELRQKKTLQTGNHPNGNQNSNSNARKRGGKNF